MSRPAPSSACIPLTGSKYCSAFTTSSVRQNLTDFWSLFQPSQLPPLINSTADFDKYFESIAIGNRVRFNERFFSCSMSSGPERFMVSVLCGKAIHGSSIRDGVGRSCSTVPPESLNNALTDGNFTAAPENCVSGDVNEGKLLCGYTYSDAACSNNCTSEILTCEPKPQENAVNNNGPSSTPGLPGEMNLPVLLGSILGVFLGLFSMIFVVRKVTAGRATQKIQKDKKGKNPETRRFDSLRRMMSTNKLPPPGINVKHLLQRQSEITPDSSVITETICSSRRMSHHFQRRMSYQNLESSGSYSSSSHLRGINDVTGSLNSSGLSVPTSIITEEGVCASPMEMTATEPTTILSRPPSAYEIVDIVVQPGKLNRSDDSLLSRNQGLRNEGKKFSSDSAKSSLSADPVRNLVQHDIIQPHVLTSSSSYHRNDSLSRFDSSDSLSPQPAQMHVVRDIKIQPNLHRLKSEHSTADSPISPYLDVYYNSDNPAVEKVANVQIKPNIYRTETQEIFSPAEDTQESFNLILNVNERRSSLKPTSYSPSPSSPALQKLASITSEHPGGDVRKVLKYYEPINPDEIELTPGMLVLIEKIYPDEWCEGKILESGVEGVIPLCAFR
ncbi:hypothetical protein BKA69DRAFT_1036731 [Paraphysoderma sedebokerense]|nr:hypothetical protein BKA69DRAFT_1036731 [Paraphysoderma sedebokerense]